MRSTFSSFMNDKPHSSITDWVEILSAESYSEDSYDGIPELVDSINLQGAGPGEANRAIRKKLKYGNTHRQIRAITILRALVENGGIKFAGSFSDGRMTEQLKALANSPHTDSRVRKRLLAVLALWHRQYKDETNQSLKSLAAIYSSVKKGGSSTMAIAQNSQLEKDFSSLGLASDRDHDRERKEKGKREREEKEAERKRAKTAQKEKEAAAARKPNKQRKPFNFEQEKPNILSAIANASQASNNLINALKLVNREKESIEQNIKVQESLASAKAARKIVVRYVQYVENEELIGTLIDTNERIIAALEMYDTLLKTADHDSDDTPPASETGHSDTHTYNSQLDRLQEKQRAAIARHTSLSSQMRDDYDHKGKSSASYVHPDLADLRFNSGDGGDRDSLAGLPAPIKPSVSRGLSGDDDKTGGRGFDNSLSDYSDYDSSVEEAPRNASTSAAASTGNHRHSYQSGRSPAAEVKYNYKSRTGSGDVSDDEADVRAGGQRRGLLATQDQEEDDPFADPFADGGQAVHSHASPWKTVPA